MAYAHEFQLAIDYATEFPELTVRMNGQAVESDIQCIDAIESCTVVFLAPIPPLTSKVMTFEWSRTPAHMQYQYQFDYCTDDGLFKDKRRGSDGDELQATEELQTIDFSTFKIKFSTEEVRYVHKLSKIVNKLSYWSIDAY